MQTNDLLQTIDSNSLVLHIGFEAGQKQPFYALMGGLRTAATPEKKAGFVIGQGATMTGAAKALAAKLRGQTLQRPTGTEKVSFPQDLDAESLIQKLEPHDTNTQAAVNFMVVAAGQMGTNFQLTRKPKGRDKGWHMTFDAVALGNSGITTAFDAKPVPAILKVASQLNGKVLRQGTREFQAPLVPGLGTASWAPEV